MLCSPTHSFEGLLGHGKDMRIHIAHLLAVVGLDDLISIQGDALVRINSHQYNP